MVGTMIELPRAALRAGEIAEHAEFFSFGTNDLTQTTLGISATTPAGSWSLPAEKGIFEKDPFVSPRPGGRGRADQDRHRARPGRAPHLKLGICGEHGGDPGLDRVLREGRLDYVSCSPFRVPIARLAAAQAALGPDRRRDCGRSLVADERGSVARRPGAHRP
jgi:pyruvate,orthophosphate dikinase